MEARPLATSKADMPARSTWTKAVSSSVLISGPCSATRSARSSISNLKKLEFGGNKVISNLLAR
jgi:spore coat protein U-like protein